ncbi:MAG TPA: AbrB/MazE/SpoVT family DNA-binding domain-containing protein [Candidatus Babeliales bacterium]|nr:AbrB/MazE/SpoVT family DNA-binding domain-containing protein [Candidatus Babeliales bacterium]
MLKKLVKYGNSNALVLDKPILELLKIEEGAVVRLETDGKALMITPHTPVANPAVQAPVDQAESYMRATVEQQVSQYTHLTATEKQQLVSELLQQNLELFQATRTFEQDPELYQRFRAALAALKPTATASERQQLFYQYNPKFYTAQQKAFELSAKYKLPGWENMSMDSEKYQTMQTEFQQLFAGYTQKHQGHLHPVDQHGASALQGGEYLHEMQLLAESHQAGKLTNEQYIQMGHELLAKYLPEMREMQAKVGEIGAKFNAKK